MTTYELISYIKKQVQNNVPKDLIISKLIGVGWRREDIDEGFLNIESETKKVLSVPDTKNEIKQNEVVDKYHEPITEDNIIEIKKLEQVETPKKVELPKTEFTPKVWTPMSVPIKEKLPIENVNKDVKTETKVEIQNLELQSQKPVNNIKEVPVSKIPINNAVWGSMNDGSKLPQQEKIENKNITSSVVDLQNPDKSKGFIPNLMPKMAVNSFSTVNNNTMKPNNIPAPTNTPVKEPTVNPVKDLSKIAMLSSYQSDVLSANQANKEISQNKNRSIMKWIIYSLIIFAIASLAFAFTKGYLKLEDLNLNLNFSFIKKDPKVLLLDNSKVLSSLQSYKTETNIEVTSPTFSNITYGLISGEPIPSIDKDYISVNTSGIINKNENISVSDNFINIKSSMFLDSISTNIKNNGTELFVVVPDLSQVIKGGIVEPATVRINENQFNLIPSLFSPNIEKYISRINVYKILSNGIPSYIDSLTLNAYNEFINSAEIIEKEQENIKGIETYHYSISADRQLTKNLLIKISENLTLNLSEEDKNILNEIIGSVTINSFEVWIGKGDNNIYQYSVIADVPLSKVIGFEDKSIGDNQINVSWKTTYYDFDIANSVSMPEESVLVTDFVKKIKETKMKNEVSSFKQLATDLYNVQKNYGSKSNLKGSCMNPSSGSLFSPLGHLKNSSTAVSSISLFLNKILETTEDAGSCYSTSKAWSFAIPISDNYDPSLVPEGGYKTFFCVDSTGFEGDTGSLPVSVTCPVVEEIIEDISEDTTQEM